jgi:hypothetical protein
VLCNRILHQPGSPAVGLSLKDTDNLSPSTPKDSYDFVKFKKKEELFSSLDDDDNIKYHIWYA